MTLAALAKFGLYLIAAIYLVIFADRLMGEIRKRSAAPSRNNDEGPAP